jgi:tRNA nucleotidyltransferase (CCA-adding enzyme)
VSTPPPDGEGGRSQALAWPDPLVEGLDVYLVGGAVRDRLLGRPVKERDWVVVGASAEALQRRGFRPVGRDFPVFLHPRTHEEYALARTERKCAPGYRGFEVDADPSVTLVEDLERRDLTVNAIAQAADGRLIDPFGGVGDLRARRLRHVSEAFREDPVRILRLARFAARYAADGFRPARETLELARRMAALGEVDALVPERVWQEWSRALVEPSPWVFIEVLRDCQALARLLPELDALFGIPQSPSHHPEIDTGAHTLLVLRVAAELSAELDVRFAALMHDLGKGATPQRDWPRHPDHDRLGVPLIEAVCARFRVPVACRELAVLVSREHVRCHTADRARPEELLALLEACDAFRRPERFRRLLLVCEADARGCAGRQHQAYPQRPLLEACLTAAAAVSGRDVAGADMDGRAIASALRAARVAALGTC